MRRLEDLLTDLAPGTRVLARVDLNVPIEAGVVRDDTRLRAIVPTVRRLLEKRARVVLCSHLGRPKGRDPSLTLEPLVPHLRRLLAAEVHFLPGTPGEKLLADALDRLPAGSVALLENLRFHPGEEGNDPGFQAALSALGQVYVNDAFGSSHRAHASIVGPPARMPACAGLLVEKEVAALEGIRDRPRRPFWVILGGAKVADKLGVVRNLGTRVDGFLVGGGMANTFLASLGVPVGASRIERDRLPELTPLIEEGGRRGVEWVFPVDFVAGDRARAPSRTAQVAKGEDPGSTFAFFDIGPESRRLFIRKLAGARTVFWNGPLGVFEEPTFRDGTRDVARALAEMPGERVIGGGDTAAAIEEFELAARMSHVSTGGGASLEFLEGKSLPGLRALENA